MITAPLKSQRMHQPTSFVPLSVEQYERMIHEGILEEGSPIELIDGLLVCKDRSHVGKDPSIGEGHAAAVVKFGLLGGRLPEGMHLRSQQPIQLLPDSEPEPDGCLVRGEPDDYLANHPMPADISCVIEVSDSSLAFDRTTKLRLYADAGIPQYVIANLVENAIENYRGPVIGEGRYATMIRLRAGDSLPLLLPDGTTLDVPIDRLIRA